MARKFTKVLALMQSKGGRLEANDTDLATLLGPLLYRKASYFSNIRRRAGLEVKAVRVGRNVVAYELVAVLSPAPESTDTVVTAPAVDVATA